MAEVTKGIPSLPQLASVFRCSQYKRLEICKTGGKKEFTERKNLSISEVQKQSIKFTISIEVPLSTESFPSLVPPNNT